MSRTRLRVAASSRDGGVIAEADVAHGTDPVDELAIALRDAGSTEDVGAWLGARSAEQGGEHVVTLLYGVASQDDRSHRGSALGLDGHTTEGSAPGPRPGLVVEYGDAPVRRQRLSAYAVVEHGGRWLLTEFSDRVMGEGRWALPGGGIDVGEDPAEGVVREVWEESGQLVVLTEPLVVQSAHWTGASPSGVVEDFHAVRLIWAASCAEATEPVVHDIGGTTERALWVPRTEALGLPLTPGTRAVLEQLAGV